MVVVEFLSRNEVGYKTSLPRLGKIVPRSQRVGYVFHHTVGDDADADPNTWSRADALAYARILQTVRPELGLDVPYNFVAFVLEPNEPADLLIVEGRGWDRSGAHTVDVRRPGSENSDFIAFCFAGDFRNAGGATYLGWPDHMGALGAWVRENAPTGIDIDPDSVTGHRDHKATTCPGDFVYSNLGIFKTGLRGGVVLPPPPNWTEALIDTLPTLGLYDGYKTPPDGTKARTHLKPFVRRVQAMLAIEGHIAANTFDSNHSPDGLFGPGTEDAVMAFQKAKGLTVDGLVGENTWTKLIDPTA